MKLIESMSFRYRQGQLFIIDQTQLPHKEEWVEIKDYKDMVRAIVDLKVRGAPLIGVAAAFSLVQTLGTGCDFSEWKRVANELKSSRPTAVNLSLFVDRMLRAAEKNFTKEFLEATAIEIFNEDARLCRQISKNGASLLPNESSVLTHCNTGELATAGMGTALGVIYEAHQQGKKVHVYVGETRPLLQGGRLTTWELEKKGIPYTLICDHMAASLMARGEIDLAIVGADRVACNGDFANKVGTYNIAVLCHYHGIPFYVAAPHTTIDINCPTGREIPIEERPAFEVRGAGYGENYFSWASKKAEVFNPAFDVTPSQLVQGWIFDTKLIHKDEWGEGIKDILNEKSNLDL